MNGIEHAQQMLTLAKSRTASDRERLMLLLVELCNGREGQREAEDPTVQLLLNTVFRTLVEKAEQEIRRELAERLATAAWPPRELVRLLAADEIEIARPIIAQTPVLTDEDLAGLLLNSDIEHQIEVARRPLLGASVVEVILSQAQPAVLTALADNDTADISADGMAKLVEASREVAGIRSPLVRHPRLTPELAERLYAWVGQSLRAAIVDRFKVDVEALDAAIAQAVGAASGVGRRSTVVFAPENERRAMELALVQKLKLTGQLQPGYLIRTLRDHRLSLFMAALAELADLQLEDVERAIRRNRPELLALACMAAGVDRSAFATVLALVRQLAHGRPSGGSEAHRKAMMAFTVNDPAVAVAAIRQALAAA